MKYKYILLNLLNDFNKNKKKKEANVKVTEVKYQTFF